MNDEIRDAATQSAQQGGDIRGRVHDLTLEALKARRFDREAMRDVVRAVTEGISRGAEGSRLGVRQTLAEGFRGMDEALTASVQAGHEALRQMVAAGRGLQGMRRRLEEIGGALETKTRPGEGFQIRATLPVGTAV